MCPKDPARIYVKGRGALHARGPVMRFWTSAESTASASASRKRRESVTARDGLPVNGTGVGFRLRRVYDRTERESTSAILARKTRRPKRLAVSDETATALPAPSSDDHREETLLLISDPTPQRVLDALAEDTDEMGFRQVMAMVAIADGVLDDLPL